MKMLHKGLLEEVAASLVMGSGVAHIYPPKNGSRQCSKATLLERGSLQVDTPAADAIGDSAKRLLSSRCVQPFGGVHW